MDANLERELFKYEQVYPNSSKTCRTISTVGGEVIPFKGITAKQLKCVKRFAQTRLKLAGPSAQWEEQPYVSRGRTK
jgi:hypothetical protein